MQSAIAVEPKWIVTIIPCERVTILTGSTRIALGELRVHMHMYVQFARQISRGAVSKTGNVTGHRQINLCPQFALCHFAKFTPLMLYLKVDYSYPQLRLMNRLLINACQCPTSVTISPQHSLSTLPSERVCTAASTLR